MASAGGPRNEIAEKSALPLFGASFVDAEKYAYIVNGKTINEIPVFDIYRLHKLRRTWNRIKVSGDVPNYSDQLSAAYLHGNTLLLVLGHEKSGGAGELKLPICHVCDLSKRDEGGGVTWKSFQTTGDPLLMKHATLAVDFPYAYVVTCPAADTATAKLQVHQLDLRSHIWRRLHPGTATDIIDDVTDRHGFQISILEDEIFVLSGRSDHAHIETRFTIRVFNLVDRRWTNSSLSPDPIYGYPSVREWQSIAVAYNSMFAVFSVVCSMAGGEHLCAWRLDLVKKQWKRLCMQPAMHIEGSEFLLLTTLSSCNTLFVIVGTKDWGIDVDDVFEYAIAIQTLKTLSLEKLSEHSSCLELESRAVLMEIGIPESISALMVE